MTSAEPAVSGTAVTVIAAGAYATTSTSTVKLPETPSIVTVKTWSSAVVSSPAAIVAVALPSVKAGAASDRVNQPTQLRLQWFQ